MVDKADAASTASINFFMLFPFSLANVENQRRL